MSGELNQFMFQEALQSALGRVRAVLERYGVADWKEHLIIRKPGKPEMFVSVGHPGDSQFSEKLNRLHRDENKQPAGTAITLIALERERQIVQEGYTSLHDDLHVDGSIGRAAACYAATAAAQIKYNTEGQPLPACYVHRDWPWERESFKPSPEPLHNLVKAGAMIAAEIDRIERSRKEQRHESA